MKGKKETFYNKLEKNLLPSKFEVFTVLFFNFKIYSQHPFDNYKVCIVMLLIYLFYLFYQEILKNYVYVYTLMETGMFFNASFVFHYVFNSNYVFDKLMK